MDVPVIVDAVRTAVGGRGGGLSGWHATDLLALVLEGLATRTGLDPATVDDVVAGCAMPVGSQGFNIGRNAVLGAGWPDTVPGVTVDRQCSSSHQSLHMAAHAVAAGAAGVVVAAGVEVMSSTPAGASVVPGSLPFGPSVLARYAPVGGLVPQGVAIERLAARLGLTRDDLDAAAVSSHDRATAAAGAGRFTAEIIPVPGRQADRERGEHVELRRPIDADECVRRGVDLAELGAMKPLFDAAGVVTAGNAAPIADAAGAALVTSESRAAALGLRVSARVAATAVTAVDPVEMVTGAAAATRTVLDRAGLTIADVDVVELLELSPPVVVAWRRELGADPERVNVNGGAVALGHPMGASGVRLLATLLHELARREGRWGLLVTSGLGGVAMATLLERH